MTTKLPRIPWRWSMLVCGALALLGCGAGSGLNGAESGGAIGSGTTGSGGTAASAGSLGSGGESGGGGSSSSSGIDASASGPLDPTAFGNKYKLADNQISGWTQTTDPTDLYAYGVYSDANLDQRIDGGNTAYISRGMRVAMFQDLVGPSQTQCTAVAMDFSTSDNATTMFSYEVDHTGATIAIPPYDASTALAYPTLSGITAYAHFNASYFETRLIGIPDQTAAAQVAAQFLQVFESKP